MSKAAELAALIGSQSALSNRNLVINGAMQVAQRGTSAVTITSTGEYPNIDRYSAGGNDSSLISVEQSTDAPSGFEYSLKVTSLAASTTDAADYQFIGQRVEGYNTAQLDWGASGAKTATVSFYVKCSVTGNIPFVIVNSNDTRVYAANCTVSSANTWEYKTITIDGDISGTWLKTNGIGLKFQWYMALGSNFQGTLDQWGTDYGASGQINVCNTNGATFQVTGVQLEVGEQATPFEHRSYGDELRRCQRYYNVTGTSAGHFTPASVGAYGYVLAPMSFPVEMRSAPSMTNTSFDDAGTGSYHGAFQSITTYRYVQEMRDASGNLYGQTINTADAEL
jgi:hypothetical protein